LIVFEKVVKHSRLLNPLKGFAEDSVTFEYRADPLTGRNSTVIDGMLGYVSGFLKSDEQLLSSLVEKTRAGCPFCPESVRTRTPMFTPEFLEEGRLCFGDAVVVPNLLGHAERSFLVVLSKEHYLKLDQFTPELILNGFRGGVAYLRRLKEVDASIRFPAFVFNYLPPAGSSIFHPHMQVLVRDRSFYLVGLTLEKSRAYSERHGSSYWRDLVEKERGGERHLFASNGVEWLVPFAPLRGMNEVQAVVPGRSNLLELSGEEWSGLAEGVSRVLRFYQGEGYSSFNVVLMSAPLNEHLDCFDVNLRIISRSGVQASSFTDAWALPYLLWDGEAVEEPEKLAERVRRFISKVRTHA
jgi:UDPglucose--hexose-1-phosphate uridylyltransferase